MAFISIVIPVYNEQSCLEALFERFLRLQKQETDDYEFIFIDDGSTDNSKQIIRKLSENYPSVKYLFFSRNFGHENATTAGLDHASGDATVIIDADLQDPPEVIPKLIQKWREGYQIVYAKRKIRKGEKLSKRLTSWLFYRIIKSLTDTPIPTDTGDFRLMDKQVVNNFRRCRERNRFVRGLVSWTGFKQAAIEYERDARFAGETKYNFLKLIILALNAVIGFSNLPLRIGIAFGLLICLGSFVMTAVIILQKLVVGIPIAGYALLGAGLFFLGGIQLLVAGLIGEYIGQIYSEIQARPLYIVQEKSGVLPKEPEGWYPISDSVQNPSSFNPQNKSGRSQQNAG